MSETKIAGDYTDRKGVQAHLGLMILLLMTLISKDNVEGAQAIASIFVGLAIPFFLVSLVVLPTETHDKDIFRMQLIFGVISLHAGHLSGLIALAFVFGSFNVIGAVIFVLSAIVAYVIFAAFLMHKLGLTFLDKIWSIVTGQDPEQEEGNGEILSISASPEADEKEVPTDGSSEKGGHAA